MCIYCARLIAELLESNGESERVKGRIKLRQKLTAERKTLELVYDPIVPKCLPIGDAFSREIKMPPPSS